MTTAFAHASDAIVGARDGQEDNHAVVLLGPKPATGSTAVPPDADGSRPAAPVELLAVVADGMGGHVAGEEASRVACDAFVEAYSGDLDGIADGSALETALQAADDALETAIAETPSLFGMGCTLIGVSLTAAGLRWISVGDSLVFLWRDGTLSRLNEDHSMAPLLDDLAARGLMDRHEAATSPRRHHLRSALTGSGIDLVDHHADAMALNEGDWLIVATDGIETLPTGRLEGLIRDHKTNSPAELVKALLGAVEAAREPFQDNTTIVAIQPRPARLRGGGAGDLSTTGTTTPMGRRFAV